MRPPTFVYGTLCSPQVMQVLLNRPIIPPSIRMIPATLYGHARYPVQGYHFPGTIATPDHLTNCVSGLLVQGLTELEEQLLDYFEGDEYEKVMVDVVVEDVEELRRLDGGGGDNDDDHDDPKDNTQRSTTTPSPTVPAQVYLWKNPIEGELDLLLKGQSWEYAKFEKDHLEEYLETTVKPCRLEMERLGMTTTTT